MKQLVPLVKHGSGGVMVWAQDLVTLPSLEDDERVSEKMWTKVPERK